MKKIFTLIAAFMAVAGAYAQDLTACLNDSYAGKVIVTINEDAAEPSDANVTITKKAGNKIDFTLRNFILMSDEDMMPVGNVELVDIDLVAATNGKGVTFATTQDIMIGEGDLEGVDFWVGPLISAENAIPVVLSGKADGDDVDIDIDIDLPALGQVVHVDFIAKAPKLQIENGDFESWTNYSSSNNAPDNWNSFQTAEGGYAGMVKAKQVDKSTDVRPGSAGQYSVVINCRSVLGIPAQGNLTLGCINAGSMTAANKDNYNFSKTSDESKSEKIDAVPVALKAWVKFVPAKDLASYPYARVSAYVHDEYNYIVYSQEKDDTDENKSHLIASGELNFEACDWTEITVPITATGNTTEGQKYIIVNFSTNATPGKGTKDDKLYIDDITLVYDETASITEVSAAPKTVSGIYNLNGQRINSPKKGLNIINGKKVLY